MIILNMPQGSIDWIKARLWRLTASELSCVLSPATGALSQSKAAKKHVDKLMAGIQLANVMNQQPDTFEDMNDRELSIFMAHYVGSAFSGNIHTERGNLFEADAIAAMSKKIGQQIQDVGMCLMGDDENSVVSCSPDGVLFNDGKMTVGAEVKNPCLSGYLRHVREDVLPPEHALQVHSGMAICEVDTWHYGSYFDGEKLFYKEVKRDKYTDTIKKSLDKFTDVYRDQFADVTEKLEKLNDVAAISEESVI